MIKKRNVLVLAIILVVQLVLLLPHAGSGFIKDDFKWIDNAVTDGRVDYLKPFTSNTGFYRPLVSLSFGLQYFYFQMNPLPYGLLNLLIHLLNIFLVYLMLRSFESLRSYALLVTVLFSLNVKTVTMAVGWISGRTTLLYSFFVLLVLYLSRKGSLKNISNGLSIRRIVLYSL